MKSKIFAASLMALFLISFASAIVIDSTWTGDVTSITIQNGESVDFDIYTFSTNYYPMTITATLYDSANNAVQIASGSSSTNTYMSTETINQGHYLAPGTYELVIAGTDAHEIETKTLTLIVEEDPSIPIPDTTSPTITITSPVSGTEYNTSTIVFQVSTDEEAEVSFTFNSQTYTMSHQGDNVFLYTLNNVSNGTYQVIFTATDLSENEATASISFSVAVSDDSDDDDDNGNIDDDNAPTGYTNLDEDELDFEEQAYLNQFEPETILLGDDETEETISFFQKIWNAIIYFFKRLFGLN